jgi:hypothetical protein
MYGKVFTSMYDGTLATRGPWQALVTFQQFLVLKDRGGIVDMTPDAISRRTTIPIEIINIGIAALEQVDTESRSNELEGRRIVRLDPERSWGWKVVNHEKYNKIRSEDDRREYMRNLMAEKRKKGKETLAVVSNCKQRLAKLAHIDVDVDVDVKKHLRTAVRDTVSISPGFEQFWYFYPKKQGKKAAIKAWNKIEPDDLLRDKIYKSLNTQVKSEPWRASKGKFIPHAATWINGERWNDQETIVDPPSRMGNFVI